MSTFNILDHIPDVPAVSTSGEGHVSESALYNEQVGICPKCGMQMTTSVIANNDSVFYCPKDRVALPLPNSN
jgi:hypothetical protein